MATASFRLGALFFACLGLGVATAASGQLYPAKSVRLVVAGSPGGGADLLARPIAQRMSEAFSQQIVVENRAGGGGLLATQAVLAAEADGYTMFFANAINMVIAPVLRAKLPFDPLNDFAPVTMVATTPLMVAVHPSLPVKSVRELVALARSKPGQVVCASNGEGTIQHLTIEMFNRAAGISLLHIPYKGGTPAVIDTVGGQTQMIITAVPTVLSQVRASRLRAIAITSKQRMASLDQVPTMAESGYPDFEAIQWFGIFARAKTPVVPIKTWSEGVRRAIETPSVKTRLTQEAAEPAANGPQAMAEFHRADIAKWRKVVQDSGIAVQ